MERLTKKPGEFRARCKKGAWVPVDDILRLPREEQPDQLQTRWDRKLKTEVGLVPCSLDTADRAKYLAHMAEVHGSKPRGPRQLKKGTGMWNGPRLKDEGQPLKTGVELETCTACGLVAEVSERAADVLWWDEHQRLCAGTEAAVA